MVMRPANVVFAMAFILALSAALPGHAHESYFASYGDNFIFRGPIRSADGADNIGTALLLELPDRAAADKFWNEEPFARNGGYQRDARIIRWVFGD